MQVDSAKLTVGVGSFWNNPPPPPPRLAPEKICDQSITLVAERTPIMIPTMATILAITIPAMTLPESFRAERRVI